MGNVKDIETCIEKLPAHTFVGIRNINAGDYWTFWQLQKSMPGLDCHTGTGLLESIGGRFGQVGGWFHQGGRRGYLYGVQIDLGYAGGRGRTRGRYPVFFHPPFNYEQECVPVHERILAGIPLRRSPVQNDRISHDNACIAAFRAI